MNYLIYDFQSRWKLISLFRIGNYKLKELKSIPASVTRGQNKLILMTRLKPHKAILSGQFIKCQ